MRVNLKRLWVLSALMMAPSAFADVIINCSTERRAIDVVFPTVPAHQLPGVENVYENAAFYFKGGDGGGGAHNLVGMVKFGLNNFKVTLSEKRGRSYFTAADITIESGEIIGNLNNVQTNPAGGDYKAVITVSDIYGSSVDPNAMCSVSSIP